MVSLLDDKKNYIPYRFLFSLNILCESFIKGLLGGIKFDVCRNISETLISSIYELLFLEYTALILFKSGKPFSTKNSLYLFV